MKKVNEAVRDTNTKILVTSQPEKVIRGALKEVTCASFSEHEVKEFDVRSDIEKLSKAIVAEKLRDKDETIQAEMAKKMSDRSTGQFLWLRLQRDSLSEGVSRQELQKAIEEMPTTIGELVSRSWKTINRRKNQARVVVILRLVVYSLRSLTTRELSEAILMSDDFHDSQIHELLAHLDEKTFKEEILDLCGSFLITRKQKPDAPFEEWTIHLVHSLIKDFYLRHIGQQDLLWTQPNQSDSLWIAEEHSCLADLCLKYMSDSYARRKTMGNTRPSPNSFINYAAEFWFQHNKTGTNQRKLPIEKFFDENAMWWSVWMKWFDLANDGWANATSDRDPAVPLCYVIELEYVDLAMNIIKKGVYRVNYSSNGRTALGVACSKGYEDLARALLAHGAKVGVRDVYGRTAVYYAALNGHSELVRLLIDNGADINTRDYNGASPFLAASSNGHLSIMRQLIQKGADIHLPDKDGNDALLKASSNGHLNAARVLIMKGAHRELLSYTIPPIIAALKSSSSDLARLLIEKEDDVNIQADIKKLAILHVAIAEGKTEIAKLLIERSKVDITLQDADGRTPLFVACLHGNLDIVRLLVPKKDTVNNATPDKEEKNNIATPDKKGKTPLYAACVNGHLEIATLLIEHGADANASDEVKTAPLSGAILGGSVEVVENLTKRIKAADVSVDIRNDAILAVSQKGDVKLLKLLIHWIGHDIETMYYEWVIKESSKKGSEEGSEEGSEKIAKESSKKGPVESSNKSSANDAHKSNIKDTALLLASDVGHVDVVDLLLKNDASHSYSNPRGQTALYAACCNGHLEVAKLLILGNADIKATEEEGQTPLMAACANGNLDLVKLLLEKGAVVNAKSNSGMVAAFTAAQCGHLDVLRLLLSKGADICHEDGKGLQPIHAASQNGHSKIVEFLIDSGADVTAANKDKITPLWLASSDNRVDVANILLKHGVDVDARDSTKQTPLLIASSNGHFKMAKLLLSHCANIRTEDDKGQTPLFCASANGHLDVVKLLLDHGADMTPNMDRQTPAYVASSKGHVDIVRLLIESGADVTTRDKEGRTLLHASWFSGHIKTTQLLLGMGADINSWNKNDEGWSLITAASAKDHKKIVQLLIEEHKVDAEIPDGNGITPLIAACQAGHVRTTRYLLEKGVNVNRAAKDTTPLQAARSKDHEEVVKLLVDRGAKESVVEPNGVTAATTSDDSETPNLSDTN
ncbi:hypothetical protein TGAMA5MH_06833 [Trichoderma gamsii]|uniref:Uncharacterized protein n=1 Tax=Trichoderma gamsii TaxID=398673 RepID=A0A2K0T609_9HYPO|nr:hypothetical protein TGAMA5MH_06833 [Trichoderma gamsii]